MQRGLSENVFQAHAGTGAMGIGDTADPISQRLLSCLGQGQPHPAGTPPPCQGGAFGGPRATDGEAQLCSNLL